MIERKFRVHSWEKPATKYWRNNPDFPLLETGTVEALGEILSGKSFPLITSAVDELISHGNDRKAAELTRLLVQIDPDTEQPIRKCFGRIADILLEAPLNELPISPSQYSRTVQLEFIQ